MCLGDRGLVEARHVSLPKIDGMIIGEVVDENTPDIDPQSSKISPSTTNHERLKLKTIGGVKKMVCTVSTECNMDDAATPESSDKERFNFKKKPTTVDFSEDQEFRRLQEINIIEPPPRTYFLYEETRKFYLLLDTGATHSLLPSKYFWPSHKSVEVISGVTGTTMETCGKIEISLDFGLPLKFQHEFLIADLSYSYGILGTDFLCKNNFQICFESCTVSHVPSSSFVEMVTTASNARALNKLVKPNVDQFTFQCMESKGENLPCESVVTTPEEEQCKKILNSFPNLLTDPSYFSPPKHNFVLDIELKDECAIYQRPRKVPAAEFHAINDNFEKLLRNGAVVKKIFEFC